MSKNARRGLETTDTADEPAYSYHYEPPAVGGAQYVRCEHCGRECVPANLESVLHTEDCPEAAAWRDV
jgi:hypothetical protein